MALQTRPLVRLTDWFGSELSLWGWFDSQFSIDTDPMWFGSVSAGSNPYRTSAGPTPTTVSAGIASAPATSASSPNVPTITGG